MSNPIKYSTGTESQALKKGNLFFGSGDVGKGPTSSTGYYNGYSPPSGGYMIYLYKSGAPGDLSYFSAGNDTQLISFTNNLANTSFTSATQCLNYFNTQTDKMVFNIDYPPIVTSGLVLSYDAGFVSSYSTSGTSWYDMGPSGNTATLTNGPTFSSTNGGCIVFDGVDDYVLLNSVPVFNTELTYCGFVYPTNLTGNRAIFSFRGILLQVYTNGLTYWSNITTSNKSVTASGLNLNQWNFISISQINDKVTFYYNSNNLGTFTMTNPLSASYGYKEIGRFGEGDRQFAGNMGNFLFYNRALSATEITQNYEAIGTRYVTFDLQYMVVAGGGGGGTAGYAGGGGGAGGLLTGYTTSLTTNTNYTITIGSGGPEDTNGSNSVFHTVTVIGGGKGGVTNGAGGNGGSGGGGGANYPTSVPNGLTPSGSGTTGQGYDGGVGKSVYGDTRLGGIPTGAGGGGGAGQVGGVGTTTPNLKAGDGGNGLYFSEYTSLGGSPSGWFAGGGGGSTSYSNKQLNGIGLGGQGGGGKGSQTVGNEGQPKADNGVINTGGGGGGGGYGTGSGNPGSGGSGIIILRVPDVYRANFSSGVTASVTRTGGYKYYKITATSTTSETVSFS